jgi:hypothetical protein
MAAVQSPDCQEALHMRLFPALALSASLALGACTYPDGSPNYGGTAVLGIGAAALVGLAAVAASNNNNHNDGYYRRDYRGHGQYRRHGGYRHDRYGYQDRYAYQDRGWRRW